MYVVFADGLKVGKGWKILLFGDFWVGFEVVVIEFLSLGFG